MLIKENVGSDHNDKLMIMTIIILAIIKMIVVIHLCETDSKKKLKLSL